MDKNSPIKAAISDIAVIKQTIEKSKINLQRLSGLFLCMGIVLVCTQILRRVAMLIAVNNRLPDIFLYILHLVPYITLTVLFIVFIKMRSGLKQTNNRYTLQLFDMWGIIMFAIPAVTIAISTTGLLLNRNNGIYLSVMSFISSITVMINYAAVITGMIFTGITINKRLLTIIGIILLLAVPLGILVYISRLSGEQNIIAGILGITSTLCGIARYVIFIFMGIYFKLQSGDKNGAV